MGLTSFIQTRNVENPQRPLTDASLITLLGGLPTYAGKSVTVTNAVKFIALYRAVSLVSGVIAGLPLIAKSGFNVVNSRFLTNPHPDLTSFELVERILWHLLLSGDSFSQKIRDGSNAVTYIDPFPLDSVIPRRVRKTGDNPWGKEFDVYTDSGIKTLTPFDVLHIPGPGYDGISGLSPVGVARQGIGVGLAAEEFGGRHFGSGAIIDGILQTDQKIDQTTADNMKTRWNLKRQQSKAGTDIAILDAGLKYIPIGMKPADAQYIETRIFAVGEIARLYGIPLHLLSETSKSTSWGTGIEQQNIGLIVFTLSAWMNRIEQRLSKECLPPGVIADFDESHIARGDYKSQVEAAKIAVESGLKRRNEARGDLRMPPVEGGDLLTISSMVTILGEDGLPLVTGTPAEEEPAPDEEPDEPEEPTEDDEDEEEEEEPV